MFPTFTGGGHLSGFRAVNMFRSISKLTFASLTAHKARKFFYNRKISKNVKRSFEPMRYNLLYERTGKRTHGKKAAFVRNLVFLRNVCNGG